MDILKKFKPAALLEGFRPETTDCLFWLKFIPCFRYMTSHLRNSLGSNFKDIVGYDTDSITTTGAFTCSSR